MELQARAWEVPGLTPRGRWSPSWNLRAGEAGTWVGSAPNLRVNRASLQGHFAGRSENKTLL